MGLLDGVRMSSSPGVGPSEWNAMSGLACLLVSRALSVCLLTKAGRAARASVRVGFRVGI